MKSGRVGKGGQGENSGFASAPGALPFWRPPCAGGKQTCDAKNVRIISGGGFWSGPSARGNNASNGRL